MEGSAAYIYDLSSHYSKRTIDSTLIWKCIHCDKELQGGTGRKESHISGLSISGQSVAGCKSTSQIMLDARVFIKERENPSKKRKLAEASRTEQAARGSFLRVIEESPANLAHMGFQDAVMEFLVMTRSPASLVSEPSFRRLFDLASKVTNPSKALGHRHLYSLYNPGGHSSEDEPRFGTILQRNFENALEKRNKELSGIQYIGGTLCSDGAKNRRRNALNSVLMTSKGTFFVQSTDASGKFKSAVYLFEDIQRAIEEIGAQYVFIVCMDGACKKTLRLIGGFYKQIFGQRCSTHGTSLLLKDLGLLFGFEIEHAIRLLHFICHHDGYI
jgi:hypothetical protein